jgi:hypothetical protein
MSISLLMVQSMPLSVVYNTRRRKVGLVNNKLKVMLKEAVAV